MYAAYCNNIDSKVMVDNIIFTDKKRYYINRILFLDKSSKGNDWFILKGTNLLFHRSWLNTITEDSSKSCISYSNGRGVICNHLETSSPSSMFSKNYYIDTKRNIKLKHRSLRIFNISELYSSGATTVETFREEELITCPDCKVQYTPHSDHDGVCQDCFEKNHKDCCMCGNTYYTKDAPTKTDDGDKEICPRCLASLSRCRECDIIILKKQNVIEGEVYCDNCGKDLKKQCVECNICKSWFKKESKYLRQTKKGYICEVCEFDSRTSFMDGGIREYSWKPKPKYFGEKTDKLFFGIELEVVTPYMRELKNTDKVARLLQYKINEDGELCYCKYDRSIGSQGMNGFEVVTHPMSWKYICSNDGSEKINNILDIKQFGCTAFHSNTCGMHVHMSKRAFGSMMHLYNFLRYIYNNSAFSIMISEREDRMKIDEYCNYGLIPDQIEYMATNQCNHTSNRHIAVNLDSSQTVEVRIFRSTLRLNRFMKNLEFCKSLFEFSALDYTNIKEYCKYVDKNKSIYPNLYNFLVKKGEIV